MGRQLAVALVEAAPVGGAPQPAPGALAGLRRRFAQATCREEVEIDFLEDDLRLAREAVGSLAGYLVRLERVLGQGWPGRQALTFLAATGDPEGRTGELSELLADVRRRLRRLAQRA